MRNTRKLTHRDIDVILAMGSATARSLILEMIVEDWVKKNHTHKISYNKKRKTYRTYVGIGKKRKEVTARSLDSLYEKIFTLSGTENIKSFRVVFDETLTFRRDGLGIKTQTIERDRQDYNRFVDDELANMDIAEIDSEYIARYINNLCHRLDMKTSSLDKFIYLLNHVFDYAHMKKYISESPMQYIDKRVYYKLCSASGRGTQVQKYTANEVEQLRQRLFQDVAGGYDGVAYATIVATYLGNRIGELPYLRWDDISNDSIRLHRQQTHSIEGGYREESYTKNERLSASANGRVIPFKASFKPLKKLFMEIRTAQLEAGFDSEYVFIYTINDDKKGQPITKNAINIRLRHRSEELGFDVTRMHGLRRYVNSELKKSGLKTDTCAYLLGHSPETNERFYSQTREEEIFDILDEIDVYTQKNDYTRNLQKKKRA